MLWGENNNLSIKLVLKLESLNDLSEISSIIGRECSKKL